MAGYQTGWENVEESTADQVVMSSARHKAQAIVRRPAEHECSWLVSFPSGPPQDELEPNPANVTPTPDGFHASTETALRALLRRAAELAKSLPDHAAQVFAQESAKIDAQPPSTTEAIGLVKRRVGQDLFRKALMEYWGGACAVTGLALPPLLRASHAKPWASCESDAERLDVFNGFLLAAHLDALFDQGLMTFSDSGEAMFSTSLDATHQDLIGLDRMQPLRLRWIRPNHQPYLTWHRNQVFESA